MGGHLPAPTGSAPTSPTPVEQPDCDCVGAESSRSFQNRLTRSTTAYVAAPRWRSADLMVGSAQRLAEEMRCCTNAEAAQWISFSTETVKSYPRSAASKLGTHSRHEAVSKARRGRLIP